MRALFCILATACLLALSTAAIAVGVRVSELGAPSRDVIWFDDMEGDVSQWRSVDLWVDATPHFHWDQYMAFGGSGYSWWCGTFDYDADGGYGDMWDDRLDLPAVDLSTNIYPVLTFAYRHDSEVAYDYTYVQAESLGAYVNLDSYNGHQGWFDIGTYGFILLDYDDPFKARFRFVSDALRSDEDGLYLSEGGAFACDNIKIYDYATGAVNFYDSEPGSDREDECVPSVPEPAGDYWHVIDRACPAYSDPHSWWCGDDADTSLVPPNLRNGLYSPVIDLSEYGTVVACTVHFAIHMAIPARDVRMYGCGDYCKFFGTCDGVNYYALGRPNPIWGYWYGDMGQCDGWSSGALGRGFVIDQFCPEGEVTHAGMLWVMYTDDNGCGPGGGGDAGAMIDDVWFEITVLNPVEEASWGSIKAMFR